MKKKNILFATCLLGAFAFSSCEKNLYDESKQSEKEIKMTDLNIPEDFQWNLTQVTKGTTIANTQTKVSLFLDEKCSKDEKVATIRCRRCCTSAAAGCRTSAAKQTAGCPL